VLVLPKPEDVSAAFNSITIKDSPKLEGIKSKI
jgi:hypothetical protein